MVLKIKYLRKKNMLIQLGKFIFVISQAQEIISSNIKQIHNNILSISQDQELYTSSNKL